MKAEENTNKKLASKRKSDNNETTNKASKHERNSLVRTEIFGNTTLLPSTINYNSAILPDAIFLTTSSGQLITTTVNPTMTPILQSNILQEKYDTPLHQQQLFHNAIMKKEDDHQTRDLNKNIKSSQQQHNNIVEAEDRGAAAMLKKKKNKNKKQKPSATQPTSTTTTTAADDSYSKTKKNTNNSNINSSRNKNKKKQPNSFTPSTSLTTPSSAASSTTVPSDFLHTTTPLTSIAGIIEQVKVARARNELSLITAPLPPLPPSPITTSPTTFFDTSSFLKTAEEQRGETPVTPPTPTVTTNNDLTPIEPTQLLTASLGGCLPTTTFVVTNDHLTNNKETSFEIPPQSLGTAATAFANFPLITSGLTGFAQANFTTFSLQAPLLTPGLTIPFYNSLVTVSAKDGVLPSLNKELFPTVGGITTTTTKKTKTGGKKKNNNSSVVSQQNGSDMTTSRGRKRTAQSRLPAKLKEPAAVARRNARERRRVKMVNDGFLRLRRHVPTDPKNKKLSKVKTLKLAIEYIHHLQTLLQADSTTKQTTQSIVSSFTAQMSNYDDLDDETAEWLQPDSLVSPAASFFLIYFNKVSYGFIDFECIKLLPLICLKFSLSLKHDEQIKKFDRFDEIQSRIN